MPEIGDWVCFRRGGNLIISCVRYFTKSITGRKYAQTDVGEVNTDDILEIRKPNGKNITT